MVTFVLGALCGVAAGRVRGGRLISLTTLRFRAPILLAVAALTQAGAAIVDPNHRLAAVAAAYAVVGIWLMMNAFHERKGIRLGCVVLGVGWLLNLVPIMLNGGMPVSAAGLERVGAPKTISVTEGHFYKHVPAGHETRLIALGDVIPLPMAASVISIGDIVMLAGIALVVAAGMTSVPELQSRGNVSCQATRSLSAGACGVTRSD